MRTLLKLLACMVLASPLASPAVPAEERLKCSAEKIGPLLDFEFRYVAGFWFSLPVKQFWGRELSLEVSMLVTPVNGTPGKPMIVEEQSSPGEVVPEGLRGEVSFPLAVSLGVGQYRTNWRIRDDRGRVCQGTRLVKAVPTRRERDVNVSLPPGKIVNTGIYMFRPEEQNMSRQAGAPRRVKIFISLDVLGRRGRVVKPRMGHMFPLFAALRQFSRSPHFTDFSVVAFSFEDQKVLVRQNYQKSIDFPSMRGVVRDLRPLTVDLSELARGSEMKFFEEMLAEELLLGDSPHAIVFVGQDVQFGKRIRDRYMEAFRQLGAEVSFLDGSRFAWRGAIGNFVRALGGREHPLRQPRDLARAISSLEERMSRSMAQ